MPKRKIFCSIYFCWKAFTYQISENFIKQFEFCHFLHFLSIFAVFCQKRSKKAKIEKLFFCSIFFCLEVSTYQISQNFIKWFEFCKFSSLMVNFGWFLAVFWVYFSCFLAVFWSKKPKSKNSFFVAFSFVRKHLLTKFQKISSNSLNFANFLHLWSILSVFWLFFGQKRAKSKNSFFSILFC